VKASADIDFQGENRITLQSGKVISNNQPPVQVNSGNANVTFFIDKPELPAGLLDAVKQAIRGCGGVVLPTIRSSVTVPGPA
jgi:hypothetical protein